MKDIYNYQKLIKEKNKYLIKYLKLISQQERKQEGNNRRYNDCN